MRCARSKLIFWASRLFLNSLLPVAEADDGVD